MRRIVILLSLGCIVPIACVVVALAHKNGLAQVIDLAFFGVSLFIAFGSGVGPVRRVGDETIVARYVMLPFNIRILRSVGRRESGEVQNDTPSRVGKLGVLIMVIPSFIFISSSARDFSCCQ